MGGVWLGVAVAVEWPPDGFLSQWAQAAFWHLVTVCSHWGRQGRGYMGFTCSMSCNCLRLNSYLKIKIQLKKSNSFSISMIISTFSTYSSENMHPSFYCCFWDPGDPGPSFYPAPSCSLSCEHLHRRFSESVWLSAKRCLSNSLSKWLILLCLRSSKNCALLVVGTRLVHVSPSPFKFH